MAFINLDNRVSYATATVSEKLRKYIFKKVDPSYRDSGEDNKWNLYCPDEVLTHINNDIGVWEDDPELLEFKKEAQQLFDEAKKNDISYVRFL